MNYIKLIFFFILGVILGELYTTIATRLPNDEENNFSKSHCDICFHRLRLYEIIPIFSYIFLKGRCSYCHKKINIKNPLIEIATGILFMLSYYVFNETFELLIALGIISLLILITVSDITYLIIPDEILIFFSGYFIIINYLNLGLIEVFKHITTGALLFGLMYMIMLIGNKVFKKESLGGGDIKLMFLFGLVLDPLTGIISIFIASILALPLSLILLYKDNEKLIPFGPFLLLSFTLLYFLKVTPTTIINLLNLY